MARSEICPGCSKSGGALFDVTLSTAYLQHEATHVPIEIPRYAKQCRNCGRQKPIRHRRPSARRRRIAATLARLCGDGAA